MLTTLSIECRRLCWGLASAEEPEEEALSGFMACVKPDPSFNGTSQEMQSLRSAWSGKRLHATRKTQYQL